MLSKTFQAISKPNLINSALALILFIVNLLTVNSQINIITDRLRNDLSPQSTNKKKGLNITVSDPTQTLKEVAITISIKLKGTGSVINTDNTSTIKFVLPSADEAGKSVTFEFEN